MIRRSHICLAPCLDALSSTRSIGGTAVNGSRPPEPPDAVRFSLSEALELLAAFEESRDVIIGTDHLSVVAQVVDQMRLLSSRLGFAPGGSRAT